MEIAPQQNVNPWADKEDIFFIFAQRHGLYINVVRHLTSLAEIPNIGMIKITETKKDYLDALRHLFFKTRLATFLWSDSKIELSDFEKETKDEYILVALVDEIVIGFISVWVADNFIHHLYVDEKFQNQNIGTRLLNAVVDKFGFPVRLKCEENNTKAIRFYKQKGFAEKEKGQSETGTYILFELTNK